MGHALYERFRRGLAAARDRAAFRAGSEQLTYEQADRLALRWAGALADLAGGRPRAVGVLAGKGVTGYVGILAASYAGAAVVPLNPDFPVVRTRRMAAAAGIDALITDAAGESLVDQLPAVPVLATHRPMPGHTEAAPVAVAPDDPAYVLFTSGSTGRPKGVPITHANLAHYFGLVDCWWTVTPRDTFSQTFDTTFDCSMFDLFTAWGAGATAVAVPPVAYRDLPAFVADQGITVWFSTPSAIGLVRRAGGLRAGSLPGLRLSLFAGEALKCVDAADWQRAAPDSALENLYGPTELTITVTRHRWSPDSPGLGVNGMAPIGRPNAGHEHLLLDAAGRPADTEGELWLTGPQLTSGYLDPAEVGGYARRDGRPWYATGDRVRRADNGELVYLGRADSQVQVRGWRVELAEIDHAVRGCAGVEDAVTVGVAAGDSTELVVFYTGQDCPAGRFAAQLRDTLPVGLIPRHYRRLADMPLNANRKVDRVELRGRAEKILVEAGRVD
ncbi:AMP-binding protein [Kutzneria sp. NPDC052558]|uniref:AMP-binding protein n=1 Tax=Kutzneria sp. NPDC052558 TaxID=3364121 RepID=UPI0037C637FF